MGLPQLPPVRSDRRLIRAAGAVLRQHTTYLPIQNSYHLVRSWSWGVETPARPLLFLPYFHDLSCRYGCYRQRRPRLSNPPPLRQVDNLPRRRAAGSITVPRDAASRRRGVVCRAGLARGYVAGGGWCGGGWARRRREEGSGLGCWREGGCSEAEERVWE